MTRWIIHSDGSFIQSAWIDVLSSLTGQQIYQLNLLDEERDRPLCEN